MIVTNEEVFDYFIKLLDNKPLIKEEKDAVNVYFFYKIFGSIVKLKLSDFLSELANCKVNVIQNMSENLEHFETAETLAQIIIKEPSFLQKHNFVLPKALSSLHSAILSNNVSSIQTLLNFVTPLSLLFFLKPFLNQKTHFSSKS